MKLVIPSLASVLFIFSALAVHAEDYYKVTSITGTVETQIVRSLTDGRIQTSALNEKRVFNEFAVSPQDYILVYGINSGLILLPKHGAASLPTYRVFKIADPESVSDTQAHLTKLEASIDDSNTNPNLFEKLAGEVVAKLFYLGDFPGTGFKKLSFVVTARGTDQLTTSELKPALLKFKFAASGLFIQPD